MALDQTKRKKLVQILNEAKNGTLPSIEDLELVFAFCNRSIIGSSKLLHFLNPSAFAIWDKRVARSFFNIAKVDANQIGRWRDYNNTLAAWAAERTIIAECEKLRTLGPFLTNVPKMRLIELVMFHRLASKRRPLL
jgi:hypothetical protein